MGDLTSARLPLWAWILLGCLLLGQAVWIYIDATKRGEKKRVFWGLYGLLNVPSSLLVYLLVTRTLLKTRDCPACGKRIWAMARFCPECGRKQEGGIPG
jgi:hypothetical protein